jgi:hypothetical protein
VLSLEAGRGEDHRWRVMKLGADLNRVRQQVIQLLHDYQAKT